MYAHLAWMTSHWQLISTSTQPRHILSGYAVLVSLPILLEAWSSNSTALQEKIKAGVVIENVVGGGETRLRRRG